MYLVLTSQTQARSSIVGNLEPAVDAQKVFKGMFKELMDEDYSISIDIERYQGVYHCLPFLVGKQMALLFTILSGIFSPVFSATAFGGANLAFSTLTDHGAKEHKRHDLALEKLQRARDKWNENRMKRLDFINKRLREKNNARTYINNADKVMLEYYRVFAKKIKSLPPEAALSDFYHPSETEKNGELLFLQWVQVLQNMPNTSTLKK